MCCPNNVSQSFSPSGSNSINPSKLSLDLLSRSCPIWDEPSSKKGICSRQGIFYNHLITLGLTIRRIRPFTRHTHNSHNNNSLHLSHNHPTSPPLPQSPFSENYRSLEYISHSISLIIRPPAPEQPPICSGIFS